MAVPFGRAVKTSSKALLAGYKSTVFQYVTAPLVILLALVGAVNERKACLSARCRLSVDHVEMRRSHHIAGRQHQRQISLARLYTDTDGLTILTACNSVQETQLSHRKRESSSAVTGHLPPRSFVPPFTTRFKRPSTDVIESKAG